MPSVLDLATTLREIVDGLRNPSFVEVAKIAQELLAKQVRQSWALKQSADQEAWPRRTRKSFAGISKRFEGKSWGRALLDMASAADISKGTASNEGFETRGQLPDYWAWQNDGTSVTGPHRQGAGIPPR